MSGKAAVRHVHFVQYGKKTSSITLLLKEDESLADVLTRLEAVGVRPRGYWPAAIFSVDGRRIQDPAELVKGTSFVVTAGEKPRCLTAMPSLVMTQFVKNIL